MKMHYRITSETKHRFAPGAIGLLPRARPSANVLNAHRRKAGSLKHQHLVNVIRTVAVHEAGHAVAAVAMGSTIVSASIFPSNECAGWVHYIPREGEHGDQVVRFMLAGHVATQVLHDQPMEVDEGDPDLEAAAMLLGSTAPSRLPELWEETVLFATHARVWRNIVAVADSLLQRGALSGSDVEALCQSSGKPVDGLDEARVRVLSDGQAPYCLAAAAANMRLAQRLAMHGARA